MLIEDDLLTPQQRMALREKPMRIYKATFKHQRFTKQLLKL
jgi:hypothetical protein